VKGKHFIRSLEETKIFAEMVSENVKKGDVLALIGNLGTGKTTFTQGFANAIGVDESVGSPTFKLISEYKSNKFWLYHIDCYRLDNSQQFINIGGGEYLHNENGVTLIEWADIIEDVLPQETIFIRFKRIVDNPNRREITISKNS